MDIAVNCCCMAVIQSWAIAVFPSYYKKCCLHNFLLTVNLTGARLFIRRGPKAKTWPKSSLIFWLFWPAGNLLVLTEKPRKPQMPSSGDVYSHNAFLSTLWLQSDGRGKEKVSPGTHGQTFDRDLLHTAKRRQKFSA